MLCTFVCKGLIHNEPVNVVQPSDIAKDVLVSGDVAVGMIWNGFCLGFGRPNRLKIDAASILFRLSSLN